MFMPLSFISSLILKRENVTLSPPFHFRLAIFNHLSVFLKTSPKRIHSVCPHPKSLQTLRVPMRPFPHQNCNSLLRKVIVSFTVEMCILSTCLNSLHTIQISSDLRQSKCPRSCLSGDELHPILIRYEILVKRNLARYCNSCIFQTRVFGHCNGIVRFLNVAGVFFVCFYFHA